LTLLLKKTFRGEYSVATLNNILSTAYTAFLAARLDSKIAREEQGVQEEPQVIIYTGLWGCGAYGGNPTVMIGTFFLLSES
jgi:hypothetical protein